MNLILRCIDQSTAGLEVKTNIPLGKDGYQVVMNVGKGTIGTEDNHTQAWQDSKDLFFLENPTLEVEGTIVGFVRGDGRTTPILSHNVYYIVNEQGQNVERIYGQYQKY